MGVRLVQVSHRALASTHLIAVTLSQGFNFDVCSLTLLKEQQSIT